MGHFIFIIQCLLIKYEAKSPVTKGNYTMGSKYEGKSLSLRVTTLRPISLLPVTKATKSDQKVTKN